MWIRYAKIIVTWTCISNEEYESKIHIVGVGIRDTYEKRPSENIDDWAKGVGDVVVGIMCRNSCQSLSTSVFCNEPSKEVEIIYTSEMLV